MPRFDADPPNGLRKNAQIRRLIQNSSGKRLQKPIPTGLRTIAQGWRTSACLGSAVKNENNANSVAADMSVMSK
jgi:hypothetical protein